MSRDKEAFEYALGFAKSFLISLYGNKEITAREWGHMRDDYDEAFEQAYSFYLSKSK